MRNFIVIVAVLFLFSCSYVKIFPDGTRIERTIDADGVAKVIDAADNATKTIIKAVE